MGRVAVVTVTYNTGDTLTEFLRSLPEASAEPLEVIVVDNASTDALGLRRIAEAHGAQFVDAGGNIGYGAGINRGISALREPPPYILVSNPDVRLMPGAIDILVARAEANPGVATLGPRINDAHGTLYPSARQLPSLRTGIGHALFSRIWPTNPWSTRYRDESSAVVERPTGWLSGACILVRRAAFGDASIFDESYFMYFEDVDLGARVSRLGLTNLYVPTAVAVHTGAHSTSTDPRTMEREHHVSAYRYLSRKYSAWYLWPLRVVLKVGLGVRAWARTRSGRR